jgi:hypothetical protein
MIPNKKKYELELFKKYGVKLSEDDPFWLLMLMQKDMSSEIIKATKRAEKSVSNLGKFSLKTQIFLVGCGLLIGIVSTSIVLSYVYNLSKSDIPMTKPKLTPIPKVIYKDRVVYANDKNSNFRYTAEELAIMLEKLLPDDYYILDNKGNKYIQVKHKDPRVHSSHEYHLIRINKDRK